MEASPSAADPKGAADKPERVELFLLIHKALRLALCDRLTALGASDFTDAPTTYRVVAELESLLWMLERHGELEDRWIRPVLEGRAQGVVRIFDDGHAQQAELVAEVRALAAALVRAPAEQRTLAGHTLYLHFACLVAHNLRHMSEEEQVLEPVLRRMCTDEELATVHRQILGATTDAEKMQNARLMLRAFAPSERVVMVKRFLAVAPRAHVAAMVERVRDVLPAAEWQALVEQSGLALEGEDR